MEVMECRWTIPILLATSSREPETDIVSALLSLPAALVGRALFQH